MSNDATTQRSRFWKGWVLQTLGVLLILMSQLCLAAALVASNYYFLLAVFCSIALVLLFTGIRGFHAGRAMRVRFGESVLKNGHPYVLYLRPFVSELDTNGTPPNTMEPLMIFLSSSEEEKLAKAMSILGTGITVGRPGEEWPPLGFRRLYIPEKDWLTSVQRLMSGAELVLVRIGETRGILLELEIARRFVTPERLVLVVPKESFLIDRSGVIDYGTQLLPDGRFGGSRELELCQGLTVPLLKVRPYQASYSIAGIIYFDSAWVAYPRVLRNTLTDSFIHAVDLAFTPVYKQLGVRKRLRLYHAIMLVNVIYLAGFIVFFIVFFAFMFLLFLRSL